MEHPSCNRHRQACFRGYNSFNSTHEDFNKTICQKLKNISSKKYDRKHNRSMMDYEANHFKKMQKNDNIFPKILSVPVMYSPETLDKNQYCEKNGNGKIESEARLRTKSIKKSKTKFRSSELQVVSQTTDEYGGRRNSGYPNEIGVANVETVSIDGNGSCCGDGTDVRSEESKSNVKKDGSKSKKLKNESSEDENIRLPYSYAYKMAQMFLSLYGQVLTVLNDKVETINETQFSNLVVYLRSLTKLQCRALIRPKALENHLRSLSDPNPQEVCISLVKKAAEEQANFEDKSTRVQKRQPCIESVEKKFLKNEKNRCKNDKKNTPSLRSNSSFADENSLSSHHSNSNITNNNITNNNSTNNNSTNNNSTNNNSTNNKTTNIQNIHTIPTTKVSGINITKDVLAQLSVGLSRNSCVADGNRYMQTVNDVEELNKATHGDKSISDSCKTGSDRSNGHSCKNRIFRPMATKDSAEIDSVVITGIRGEVDIRNRLKNEQKLLKIDQKAQKNNIEPKNSKNEQKIGKNDQKNAQNDKKNDLKITKNIDTPKYPRIKQQIVPKNTNSEIIKFSCFAQPSYKLAPSPSDVPSLADILWFPIPATAEA